MATLALVSIPLGGILFTALGTRLLVLIGGLLTIGVSWVLIRRARSKGRTAARIVVTLMCVWATGQLALSVSADGPANRPIGILVVPIVALTLVGLLRAAFRDEPAPPLPRTKTLTRRSAPDKLSSANPYPTTRWGAPQTRTSRHRHPTPPMRCDTSDE